MRFEEVLPAYREVVEEPHKPCPFCGGKPIDGIAIGGTAIWCEKCQNGTSGKKSQIEAWAAWDKRVE